MAPTKKAAKRKYTKKVASRKAAPKQATATEAPKVTVRGDERDYNSPQWGATLEAYSALSNAGLPVPAEIADPVNAWLKVREAEKVKAEETKVKNLKDDTGPTWVRNLWTGPFALRLERQDKKRRIELKPRGSRGDMFPLEPGDENDQILLTNLNTGFIELIGNTEAKEIIAKQVNNIQQVHTPLAILTNEKGENKGQMKLKVEQEFNSQGVVVGYQDPNAPKNAPLGGIVRPGEQIQHFVPTGGAGASVGIAPQGPEATARIADDLARRKGVQGRPEDVLGLTVNVDPIQKN